MHPTALDWVAIRVAAGQPVTCAGQVSDEDLTDQRDCH